MIAHAREWLDALLCFAFAPLCAACDTPLLYPTRGCVCQRCWDSITPDLPTGASPLASFDGIIRSGVAVGVYEGALRGIVHAFKYDGRRSLAAPLGDRMRAAGRAQLDGAAAVVPVPLHRTRRRERGFNQAEDLCTRLGVPIVHALARTRHTTPQAGLDAVERHTNLAGAFVATRAAAGLRGHAVVLVDDVWTTGATLRACAACLRAVDVADVRVVTAARVAPRSP